MNSGKLHNSVPCLYKSLKSFKTSLYMIPILNRIRAVNQSYERERSSFTEPIDTLFEIYSPVYFVIVIELISSE